MDGAHAHTPYADGYLHPADEAEVIALVQRARAEGRKLRVRGSGHSPAGTFAADVPGDILVSLDRIREVTVLDEGQRLVTAGAGIHLGGDPSAHDGSGARRDSLLQQLAHRYGWTLSSTGGITHQTLGGFLSTTSAGGSLQHSVLDHVVAIRLIDGRGEVREFSAADPEGPGLAGVLPALGLLGVIVTVTLRCEPIFTIVGQEAITDLAAAGIDLAGDGDPGRPCLPDFLTRAEYARIEWWPQRGGERMLIWQAQRAALQPNFRPTRYEEFTQYPVLAEALFSTIFVIFGNLASPARVAQLLRRNAAETSRVLKLVARARDFSWRRQMILGMLPFCMRGLARAAPVLKLLGPLLRFALPWLVPAALNGVLPTDDTKPGIRRGEPQSFHDWSWEGLPMDNQANDVLLWTQFTELWVPLSRGTEVVRLLRAYFAEPEDARDSYHRSGLYGFELYGAPSAVGWIHPGYSDGQDDWSDGALRLDIYWFQDNLEDPRERFYPQFWKLLADHGITYRCHWGKEVPLADSPYAMGPRQFPHWDDWLALRAECDPDGVFLTDYWRERLGV